MGKYSQNLPILNFLFYTHSLWDLIAEESYFPFSTLTLIPILVVGTLEILCSQRTVTECMGLTKGLVIFVVSSPESNFSNSGPWDKTRRFDAWGRARYFLRAEHLLRREGDPGVRGILAFGRLTNNWLINGRDFGNSKEDFRCHRVCSTCISNISLRIVNSSCVFVCFCFLEPYSRHMEVSRLGVESELQLPAYITTTATPDLSLVCDLQSSSQQARSLTEWGQGSNLNPHGC